jgi:hypothetical protein
MTEASWDCGALHLRNSKSSVAAGRALRRLKDSTATRLPGARATPSNVASFNDSITVKLPSLTEVNVRAAIVEQHFSKASRGARRSLIHH